MSNRAQPEPMQLFYSYAHEDETLREALEKHLALLHRRGLLVFWHDRKIEAGTTRQQEIDEHLNTASLILLLISPDFLASDYCYDIEMQRALERHRRGEARVIPILLRPCSWQSAPFSPLQALPRNGIPITKWENQDDAFLEVEESLRALIEHQPAIFHPSRTSGTASQDRENMLRCLQGMYEVLLADSLQEITWIDLGLTTQPGAVQNTANMILRRASQTAHPLPPGTSIRQVYQEANQELLLLGEPGAGKSTLLYQLGYDLLREAIQQPVRPLPVLFPLSSWAEKRLPLQDWMAAQLASPLYDIAPKLSQQWIQSEQILPLLDGLDEMEDKARPACIAAINTYRHEHPLCPLVVCSRSNEYRTAAMQERLHLQSAVEIQPLSPEQLETTLLQAGKPLAALRAELKTNPDLRELANNPLWLNVLLLTFKNMPIQALPRQPSDLQQHLIQRYVQRMVERKGMDTENQKRYPLDTTVSWLSWLARQMRANNQAVFAVEQLQPAWLSKQEELKYHWSIGLFFGLLGGISGLSFGLLFGLLGALIAGPLLALIWGVGMGREQHITMAERLTWSWKEGRYWLLSAIIIWPLYTLLMDLVGKFPGGPLTGLLFGLTVGLVLGLIMGLTPEQSLDHHTFSPGEGIRRSLKNGLLYSLLFGLAAGLLFGLLDGLTGGPGQGLLVGLSVGLIWGLLGGLISGPQTGLQAVIQHTCLRFWLWQSGSFPFRVGAFLEDACTRHLLLRVGGSYRFVHRLLLDYFADLDTRSIVHDTSRYIKKLTLRTLVPAALVILVVIFSIVGVNIYQNQKAALMQAQAAANNPYPSYLSGKGTLAFVDPLHQAGQWNSSGPTSNGGACQFTGGVYHVSQQQNGYFMDCDARGTFSNFAFEVQMTVIQGDCGGIVFRDDNNGHFYLFVICQNGSYSVFKYLSSSGSHAPTLASGRSSVFHTGPNQQNKIALVVNGSTIQLYVNQQRIDQARDSSYTSGSIELIADPINNATDVAYSNARLWTL